MQKRRMAIVVASLLAVATACGGNSDTGSSDTPSAAPSSSVITTGGPSATPSCSPRQCPDNQEVKDTGCDAGQPAVPVGEPVDLKGFKGALELHQSVVCKNYFWAWTQPAAGNGTDFTVILNVNGVLFSDQPGQLSDLGATAFAEGHAAKAGEKLEVCLQLNDTAKTETCLPPYTVV